MLSEKEIHFIESQIEEIRKKINEEFDPPYDDKYGSFQMHSDQDQDDRIVYFIQQYYKLLTAYFEAKGLTGYLDRFVKQFRNDIGQTHKVSEILYHDGEPYLKMLIEMSTFLAPFKELAHNYLPKAKSRITKLIEILDETPTILRALSVVPKNEPDVYKAVKWVLDFYYDLPAVATAKFVSKLKVYRPDILVPEIETAIEFKLAKPTKNLEDYIDEVVVDAANYKGDSDYHQFIAVLCLVGNRTTKRNIKTAWDRKGFSPNWHSVIVSL